MARKKRGRTNREFLEDEFGVIIHANPIRQDSLPEPEADLDSTLKGIERSKLRDRVRAMRPYFGDTFKASKGFNLSHIDQWPKRKKNKVNQYWRIMAPLVSRPHKARYYRDPDHLREAIVYTQQEELLRGQTAALFDLNKDEVLKVKFTRKGEIKVQRGGVSIKKVYFNAADMIEDPINHVRETAEELEGATRFKLIMGPHESRGYWRNIDSLIESIAEIQAKYSDEDFDEEDKYSHFYANWLFGLIGYYGKAKALDKTLEKATDVRNVEVKKRAVGRYNERIQRRIKLYKARHPEPCQLTKGCIKADGHRGRCKIQRVKKRVRR